MRTSAVQDQIPVVRAEIPCLAPALDGEEVGFDPEAFEALAGIEDRHFWFRTRNRRQE